MIAKNESDVIARSVACAKTVADRVIVVDTGSSDDTKKIAEEAGAEVYDFEWCDDFSAARNFSFSLADGDYVMWLDADDVISESDAAQIKDIVSVGDFDVAMLIYKSGDLKYYRERILRRSMNFVWEGVVHEAITPRGQIKYFSAAIEHKKLRPTDPLRNLLIYVKHISKGEYLDERQKFYFGRELYYNKMYSQAIAVLNDFLNSDGWAQNKAEACRVLYHCYIATGNKHAARLSIVRSFLYVPPRAMECCLLADIFLSGRDYNAAKYWYEAALACGENEMDGGFVDERYSGFVPCISLCVVYDRLGDYKTAFDWNERAGSFLPNDLSYINNKRYLSSKLNGEIK